MEKIYAEINTNLLFAKPKSCASLKRAASDIAELMASTATHEMGHFGEDAEKCPCSDSGGGATEESKLVDFIILVDSSGSMSGAWEAIGASYSAALKAAKAECGKDVDPYALYVDDRNASTDSGILTTIFTTSHEAHLISKGYAGPFYTEQSDAPEGPGFTPEEGAEAIRDLIEHHPWREGACRAIFYVSDEWLDGGRDGGAPPSDNEPRGKKRALEARDAAMANGVTLFAHHLPKTGEGNSDIIASNQQYHEMVDPTGGFVIDGNDPSEGLYMEVLTKAICRSCANAKPVCPEITWPTITPCVHVSWGASDCDCIESHDDEIITITICNCYSNVTFEDVSLAYAIVVDKDGNLPPLLADGSPSAHLYPTGPICFGDIGPCRDGKETCVSRQFVLLTRGAKSGEYQIKLGGLCFKTSQNHFIEETAHIFEICKD